MEENLITVQTAQLAKEKGFNLKSKFYYNDGGVLMTHSSEYYHNSSSHYNRYSATTQSLLQSWLHKHGIHVSAFPLYTDLWYYSIRKFYNEDMFESIAGAPFNPALASDTYQEAFEKALIHGLKEIEE